MGHLKMRGFLFGLLGGRGSDGDVDGDGEEGEGGKKGGCRSSECCF